MEILLLNLLKDYFTVGSILSLTIGGIIQLVHISPPFTLKDFTVVILTWPYVVGVLLTDYLNGEL